MDAWRAKDTQATYVMAIIFWFLNVLGLLFEGVTEVVFMTVVYTAPGKTLPISPDAVGVASRFGDPGDKWVGGKIYCPPRHRVNSTEHVCAHRYVGYKGLPCGSMLIIENPRTKKKSWCRVMDRGPYGANVLSRNPGEKTYTQVYRSDGRREWYVKIRKTDKPPADKCPSQDCIGRWRGKLDLSPAVSDDLGHNGMERVKYWRVERLIRYKNLLRKKLEAIERRKNSV